MGAVAKGAQGVSTSSMEMSPLRRRKESRKRRDQDRLWAAKNGPVVVTRCQPVTEPG